MTDSLIRETVPLESLVGQVADEFLRRQEHGERPDIGEYVARYPEAAPVLGKVLAALNLLEQSLAGAAAPTEPTPEGPVTGILGDFRILREVGRGGMGVVYEAEQISLGRRVALKVLPFAAALDAKQLQRFKNEAQAAAHLHHNSIVPVHSVGCERGVHFYAMQFIEGQTLAALIQELRARDEFRSSNNERGPNPQAPTTKETTVGLQHSTLEILSSFGHRDSAFFRAVARLGIQAAEALEYAHRQGIIHRDIKPANLLLERRAGDVNPPVLWIADFGLAKLQGQGSLTLSGDLVGTLRYMSPEQALAKYAPVDERTDLYSLGATLYEMLTLEPVFPGRDKEELLRQIAFEDPRPLWRLNPAIPAELETIVLKAMAKNPEERYATAQELADDLRRWLEDKPIQARRPSLRQRAAKWARRHKTVVRAALVVLLLVVVALVVSTVFIWRAKEDLNRANDNLKQAFERERQNAYYQRIALAEREWTANNLSRYERLLDECPEDLRGWEWHYLRRLRYQTVAPLRHDAAVLCAAISPDGRRIAAGSQDGVVNVWDVPTGRNLARFLAHQDHVRGVAFSPDGRRLATGSWDKTLKVWDAETLGQDGGAALLWEAQPVGVWSVAFSPDGRYLASGGGAQGNAAGVRIWDAATGMEVRAFAGHGSVVFGVSFSPDGQCLASASADKTVRVWNIHTGQEQFIFRGHTRPVWCVAFSPDGRRLASGSGQTDGTEGELKIWDAQTGQAECNLPGHTMVVFCVAFSPDGQRLASGSRDQTVKLWDMTTGQEALTLHGHLSHVRTVTFSPDGRRLLSASHDGTVRVWDAAPGSDTKDVEAVTLRGDGEPVNSMAFSPTDQRLLASAHRDGTIRLWDPWTGKPRDILKAYTHGVNGVAFSPDGRHLAAAMLTGMVKVWDTTTWKEILAFSLPTRERPLAITFSPEGRYVAVGGYDFMVTIYEVARGQKIHELRGHHWPVRGLAYSPNGQVIASASADGTVRLWDLATGQETTNSPLRHAGHVFGVAFRPDGRQLASAGWDRTVRIWDTTTWKQGHVLRDLTGGPSSVAYSPDGRRLAWGSTDATVKVWDEATDEIHTLRGHTSWVECLAFSLDGKQIASASADGTVKIWEAPPVAVPAK